MTKSFLSKIVNNFLPRNNSVKFSFKPQMTKEEALSILNLKKCGKEDINKNYRVLMRVYHPDKFKSPIPAIKLNEAKSFLMNNLKRY